MTRLIIVILLFTVSANAETFDAPDLNVKAEQQSKEEFKQWLDGHYKKPWQERMGADFSVRGRVRHEDKDSGDVTRVQPRFQANGYVDLTADGCLKGRVSAGTGPAYSSHWDDLKTNTRDESLNFNIDAFYFDYELCNIANAHIEVGGMLNNNVGLLGPDSDGYFTGARIRYTTPSGQTKWVVSVGDLSDFDERNVFRRGYEGVNLKRLTMAHSLNDKVELITDIIDHADNLYVRAGATLKLNHVTGLVDEVHAENGWVEGEQQSMIVRFKKKIGKWALELSGSRIEDFQGEGEQIPIDSFYGDGKDGKAKTNGQFKVSFKVSSKCALVSRIRAGQSPTRTEAGFVCKF